MRGRGRIADEGLGVEVGVEEAGDGVVGVDVAARAAGRAVVVRVAVAAAVAVVVVVAGRTAAPAVLVVRVEAAVAAASAVASAVADAVDLVLSESGRGELDAAEKLGLVDVAGLGHFVVNTADSGLA